MENEDQKPETEPKEGDKPPRQRFVVTIRQEGAAPDEDKEIACDALLVSTYDMDSNDFTALIKGLKTGDPQADLAIMSQMAQGCVNVAAMVAKKIAAASGFEILSPEEAFKRGLKVIPGGAGEPPPSPDQVN